MVSLMLLCRVMVRACALVETYSHLVLILLAVWQLARHVDFLADYGRFSGNIVRFD
jgi:hypothetical protein